MLHRAGWGHLPHDPHQTAPALTQEEREEKIMQKQAERDEFEKANLGKYKLIYPCDNEERMAAYAE